MRRPFGREESFGEEIGGDLEKIRSEKNQVGNDGKEKIKDVEGVLHEILEEDLHHGHTQDNGKGEDEEDFGDGNEPIGEGGHGLGRSHLEHERPNESASHEDGQEEDEVGVDQVEAHRVRVVRVGDPPDGPVDVDVLKTQSHQTIDQQEELEEEISVRRNVGVTRDDDQRGDAVGRAGSVARDATGAQRLRFDAGHAPGKTAHFRFRRRRNADITGVGMAARGTSTAGHVLNRLEMAIYFFFFRPDSHIIRVIGGLFLHVFVLGISPGAL